jgi:hypothetical protein
MNKIKKGPKGPNFAPEIANPPHERLLEGVCQNRGKIWPFWPFLTLDYKKNNITPPKQLKYYLYC